MMTAGNVDPLLVDAIRSAGLDTVEGAFAWSGGSNMTVSGLGHRERWSLTVTDAEGRDHLLFMKRYGPEPLACRWRRWLRHGFGGSPADVELAGIRAAHAAGIPTVEQAFAGGELTRFGAKRSYILLAAVPGEALEQCLEPFMDAHGLAGRQVVEFTRQLAWLVRRFHRAGLVHRDLYTSHVFMDTSGDELRLTMIDLARVFRPCWRRFRWRAKDLAQLKYSMPDRWLETYWAAFSEAYFQGTPDRVQARYQQAIDRKVRFIARHAAAKERRRTRSRNA